MFKKSIVVWSLGMIVLSGCKQNTTEEKAEIQEKKETVVDSKAVLISKLKLEGIEFIIPETDSTRIILGSINPLDSISTFSYYHDTGRGKVYLEQKMVQPIESDYFMIPFQVASSQEMGKYIGLFKTDQEKNLPIHVDSYFIGKGITHLALASMGKSVVVTYEQPEASKERKTLMLDIEDKRFRQKLSKEWLEKVEAQVKIGDSSGHGPDLDSDEWCHAVSRKLQIQAPVKTQKWVQEVEAKLKQ